MHDLYGIIEISPNVNFSGLEKKVEIEEFHLHVYENAKFYKEKTKRWNDRHIMHREFAPGKAVLLFNSRWNLFLEY